MLERPWPQPRLLPARVPRGRELVEGRHRTRRFDLCRWLPLATPDCLEHVAKFAVRVRPGRAVLLVTDQLEHAPAADAEPNRVARAATRLPLENAARRP